MKDRLVEEELRKGGMKYRTKGHGRRGKERKDRWRDGWGKGQGKEE